MTLTGLDVLAGQEFSVLSGRSIGLLCNQASIARTLDHVIELLLPRHRAGRFHIRAVFGPEHGLWGHTQDNMIEWEGATDPRTGLVVHSLYGASREPTDEMLEGIDLFVVDIPDVGARYYTFIWSMALCMKSCAERGIPMLVMDRPNPIGGMRTEGTVLEPAFASFVGLHPLPTRHAMTAGEVALYLQQTVYPNLDLEIAPCRSWTRSAYFDETGLPWAMPSPNMPSIDTAIVYPGQCLLEATNLSEGRGTTRPFEIFGAPWVDGWRLTSALNELELPGTRFRPIQFEPTFNKYSRELCEGAFIHVTDRKAFDSVLATVAVLQQVVRLFPGRLEWKDAPYEYVWDRRPIDILAGNDWLAGAIESQTPLSQIRERMAAEREAFEPLRRAALLY